MLTETNGLGGMVRSEPKFIGPGFPMEDSMKIKLRPRFCQDHYMIHIRLGKYLGCPRGKQHEYFSRVRWKGVI